ncbi:clavesin-1-like [Nilaparvata lugens]|uniref:clavesin-1-like n=1 Tax=Nilaparvata lugens TaxID=108931 RepID=UPI00193D3835|nr:clavesin-1-like [Nilaparvata lugens]
MKEEIVYEQPTEQDQELFLKEMGVTREQVKKNVHHLKSWLASNSDLPAVQDEAFLERFHSHCKFSLEKTKKKLEIYYKTRALEPEILRDRDPLHPSIRLTKEKAFHVTLPRLTPQDKQRVTIMRLFSPDATDLNMDIVLKAGLMMLDLNMSRDLASGHILVIDSNHFSTAHLCKLTPSFIRKCDTCSTKAFPHRYSSVHFLNVLPFMQTTMNLFKTFLGTKMSSRILIHSSYETFYEYVPREILPKEYGGTYPFSITEIRDDGYRIMVEERNWYLEQGRMFAELEEKRKDDTFRDIFGCKGTFRKIEID